MLFLGKNMAAHVKVGILGLALNPKRWTIGRLTSKAGEGRENNKRVAASRAAQQQHQS